MKTKILITLIFAIIFFTVCYSSVLYATCSQTFQFVSDNIDFSFHRNYGGEQRGKAFINDIIKILPDILGLDKSLSESNKVAEIDIGCKQYGKAFLQVKAEDQVEIECRNNTPGSVIETFSDQLKISKQQQNIFEGYTLQIAYVQGHESSVKELNRINKTIPDIDYPSSMKIDGDCIQKPLWIHEYKNNHYAIRFGIFNNLREVKKAIAVLGLDENHSQIVPIKFKIEDLGKYFQ